MSEPFEFTIRFAAPLDASALLTFYPPSTPFTIWTGDDVALCFPAPKRGVAPFVTFTEDE